MHELSLIADLVDECRRRAGSKTVTAVKVRWSSSEGDEELQQAFVMLTTATALDGAVLEVQAAPIAVNCPCGYEGAVAGDETVGHLFVCPRCARVGPLASPALELLEIRLSTGAVS